MDVKFKRNERKTTSSFYARRRPGVFLMNANLPPYWTHLTHSLLPSSLGVKGRRRAALLSFLLLVVWRNVLRRGVVLNHQPDRGSGDYLSPKYCCHPTCLQQAPRTSSSQRWKKKKTAVDGEGDDVILI